MPATWTGKPVADSSILRPGFYEACLPAERPFWDGGGNADSLAGEIGLQANMKPPFSKIRRKEGENPAATAKPGKVNS